MNSVPSIPNPPPHTAELEKFQWRRFVIYLKRHWWVVALGALLIAGAQAAWIFSQPPTYVTGARLLVGGRIKIPEGSLYAEEWQHFFGTQIEILESDRLRQRTHARLQALGQANDAAHVGVQAGQTRRTAIFTLRASGSHPDYTQHFLNALMDEYLAFKKEMRTVSSDDTLALITSQFLQQQNDLKTEQGKLEAFERENNVALLQEQGPSSGAYLGRLNAQLAELQLEQKLLALMSPEGVLNQAKPSASQPDALGAPPGETISSHNRPEGYLAAKQQLQLLQFQEKEFGQFMRPKHPRMVKLSEDIARAEKLISIFEQQTSDQLGSAREAVKLKIKSVTEAVQQWEARVVDSSRRLAEWNRIKANLLRHQSLVDRLQSLLQNVDVNKHLDQDTITILDRAAPAVALRQLPLKLSLAGLIGVFAGLALVVFLEQRNDRILNKHELRERFTEVIIGELPRLTGRRNAAVPLESSDNRHTFAEAFRNIRSVLHYRARQEDRPKTFLITSALPNEGKSTVAVNLARSLAFGGARVLLVDADLRTGQLHSALNLPDGPGLSDATEPGRDAESLITPTPLAGLSFLPRGHHRIHPGELMLESGVDRLLTTLANRFDFIVMDSAPVLAASDTPALAPKADGVLFVVRNDFTPAQLAREALEMLYQRHARILGLILNCARPSGLKRDFAKYWYALPAPAA